MQRNNDLNQVSMSSIEPATAGGTPGTHIVSSSNPNHGHADSSNMITFENKENPHQKQSGTQKNKKMNHSLENGNEDTAPDVEVTEIPQFKIAGSKGQSSKQSQKQKDYLLLKTQNKTHSTGQQINIQQKGSLNIFPKKKPNLDKKNRQLQMDDNQYGPTSKNNQTDQQTANELNILNKGNFDPDVALSTGRFEQSKQKMGQDVRASTEGQPDGRIVGQDTNIQNFESLQINSNHADGTQMENEMRETSYFRQQPEPDGKNDNSDYTPHHSITHDQKSISDLIQKTNEKQNSHNGVGPGLPSANNTTKASQNVSSKNAATFGELYQEAYDPQNQHQSQSQKQPHRRQSTFGSSIVSPGEEPDSQNQSESLINKDYEDQSDMNNVKFQKNQNKTKDGIQMFKMSSRSQMRHRAQKNNKKIEDIVNGISGQLDISDLKSNQVEEPPNMFSPENKKISIQGGERTMPGTTQNLREARGTGQNELDSMDTNQDAGIMRSLSNKVTIKEKRASQDEIDLNKIQHLNHEQELQFEDNDENEFRRHSKVNKTVPATSANSMMQEQKQQMNQLDQMMLEASPNSQQVNNNYLSVSNAKKHLKPIHNNISNPVSEDEGVGPSTSQQSIIQKGVKNLNSTLQKNQPIIDQKNYETGNFGALNLRKQPISNEARSTFSALQGAQNESKTSQQNINPQQQMFTSMSDIGFPSGIPKPIKRQQQKGGDLLTTEQIQRMMNTQNNWRVRTKTIDEMQSDIADRIETDPSYMLNNSEKLVDFFVQLLTDQNFKIVLNTLNILNMIIGMPQQKMRHEMILNGKIQADKPWGLSNSSLGRQIPLIVKKLADSKNIIRQQAILCLFSINEIMRSGIKKENNFIALILPYLNNSSNWHIREELLHLLIKIFLKSQDQNEFDQYQIIGSILQLFNDQKEKIRNLALEATAVFTNICDRKLVAEIMFQLKVEKDINDLIKTRLEYGMLPVLNEDGNVEIPYQEFQNNDADSVAHSIANQSQVSQNTHNQQPPQGNQSVAGGSQKGFSNRARGNSSGRKIVAATANATNQQLGVSTQDEIIQQANFQNKRTASANNPNQFEFENQNYILQHGQNFLPDNYPVNSFSYSVGGGGNNSTKGDQKFMPQFDDLPFQDLNGSSFLPQLQKVVSHDFNGHYATNKYQKDRMIGSGGGQQIHMVAQNNMPNQPIGNLVQIPIKKSNKYLHGTPGHPHNHQSHFSQSGGNIQNQINRGNSGKIIGNHAINNSISQKSPSMFDQNTLFDMSGNVGSLFAAEKHQRQQSANNNPNFTNPTNIKQNSMNNNNLLYSQQNSEINDVISIANSAHYSQNNAYYPGPNGSGLGSNYQQTPSSLHQNQILNSSSGYRGNGPLHQQMFDEMGNNSFNLGVGFTPDSMLLNKVPKHMRMDTQNISSLLNDSRNLEQYELKQNDVMTPDTSLIGQYQNSNNQQPVSKQMRGASGSHQPADNLNLQQQYSSNIKGGIKKNNQTTFYSDNTAMTGITATTGATSINQKNKISLMKGQGRPPMHNDGKQVDDQTKYGAGPIKATRAALGNQGSSQNLNSSQVSNRDQQSSKTDLNLEQRKIIGTKEKAPNQKSLKIQTKMNSQPQPQKNRSEKGVIEVEQAYMEDQPQPSNNRSFSYHGQSAQNNLNVNQKGQGQDLNSAGIKRSSFMGDQIIGENQGEDPALLTQSSKIVYIKTDDLEPIDKNPEKAFKNCINKGLNNADWSAQFEACNIIRRVCKYHQSLILQDGSLKSLVGKLIKLADSLRSAVSRVALMTLNDMFQSLKRVMEPHLDGIIKILLKRGSDTNNFISNEADQCLKSLVQNCQEQKVLAFLQMQQMNNRSNLHRLKICQCLQKIVKQLGNNILFFKENDKLLVNLAKYLQDASQEVRQTAKIAFVSMSQSIMGQNELEKLLQRVLNEVQYKKVKEFLDKEPTHLITNQGSQIDFVITNANNQNQLVMNRKNTGKQQPYKNLRQGGSLAQKSQQQNSEVEEPLNIQAKSILNPQLAKQESSTYLNKISQQQKPGMSMKDHYNQIGDTDQLKYQSFIEQMKDLILKTQVNEWRMRLETAESLFELIKSNIDQFTKNFKMVELADALSKLLNDSNAKIQLFAIENLNKIFCTIINFIETYLQIFYKSILTNLGSTNVGVRKNSEQILKQLNDNVSDKITLLQPLVNMIQYNSNGRLKPALLDQLSDLLDHIADHKDMQNGRNQMNQLMQKQVLPVAFKLLDDNKNEVKQKTDRIFKKIHAMIGQQLLDSCPQSRLQRVCDICLGSQKISLTGTGSSGRNSQGQSTGNFGANGNQIHLNSRV